MLAVEVEPYGAQVEEMVVQMVVMERLQTQIHLHLVSIMEVLEEYMAEVQAETHIRLILLH